MRRHRAFVLAACLLLTLVLFVMGAGLLGSRGGQYKTAVKAAEASQARALAEAGLEDARTKLEKDVSFPPPGGQDQKQFSYSEFVTAFGSTEAMGGYVVTVDTRLAGEPYEVVRISSMGFLGPAQAPLATRRINVEIDLSLKNRLTGTAPNPNRGRYLNYRDEGSL